MWYNKPMENTAFSKQELNDLPKEALILLYIQMSEDFALLSDQNRMIQEQNELLVTSGGRHERTACRPDTTALREEKRGQRSDDQVDAMVRRTVGLVSKNKNKVTL